MTSIIGSASEVRWMVVPPNSVGPSLIIMSTPHCPLAWETMPAAMVGIKPSGATGAAIGGGVGACPIDDLVPLGGRLNGLGA